MLRGSSSLLPAAALTTQIPASAAAPNVSGNANVASRNHRLAFLESAFLIVTIGSTLAGAGGSNRHGGSDGPERSGLYRPEFIPRSHPRKSNDGAGASFAGGGCDAMIVWIACDIAY